MNQPVVKNSNFVASVINSNVKTLSRLVQADYEPVPDCETNPDWCGTYAPTDENGNPLNDSTPSTDSNTSGEGIQESNPNNTATDCVPEGVPADASAKRCGTETIDCATNPELCGSSVDDNIYTPENDTYVPEEEIINPICPTCNQEQEEPTQGVNESRDSFDQDRGGEDSSSEDLDNTGEDIDNAIIDDLLNAGFGEYEEPGTPGPEEYTPEENNNILIPTEDEMQDRLRREEIEKDKGVEEIEVRKYEPKEPTGPEEEEKEKKEKKKPPQTLRASLDLFLNPVYVEKTQEERYFRPTEPINQFDDIVCELKVERTEDGYQRSFEAVLTSDIETPGDGSKTKRAVWQINTGTLRHVASDANYDYYRWMINGWNDGKASGIISNDPMKSNTFAVNSWYASQGGNPFQTSPVLTNVQCKIFVGKELILESKRKLVTQCVHLWGDADGEENGRGYKIGFNFFDNLSASNREKIISSSKVISDGFNAIDPFKAFIANFAFYVNLSDIPTGKIVDQSSGWRDFLKPGYTEGKIKDDLLNFVTGKKSGDFMSCKNIYNDIFYVKANPDNLGVLGFHYHQLKTSFIVTNDILADPLRERLSTVMHETGHAFNVADEYIYRGSSPYKSEQDAWPNCTYDSNCKNYYQKEIGDLYKGGCYKGCSLGKDSYRTTKNSIMSDSSSSEKFNRVSCAAIVAQILKTDFRSAYIRCGDMRIVDPINPFDN